MKKSPISGTVLIIIGIVGFLLGCVQPFRYEMAKRDGYEVEAEIVYVETKAGADDKVVAYYANYELNDKKYQNIKIGKLDGEKYDTGDEVRIVMSPIQEEIPMFEGGILAVVSLPVLVCGMLLELKEIKRLQKKKEEK